MMLLDTSILVAVLRDKSGERRARLRRFLGGADYVLARFTEIELLQGCNSEGRWQQLASYLEVQDYAEMSAGTWAEAARTSFDLCRMGLTVRSVIDCCIAQLALEHRLTLVHDDQDFEAIGKVRPLRHRRLALP